MSFPVKEGDKLPPRHKQQISFGMLRKHATRRNKQKGVTLPKLSLLKEEPEDGK